MKSVGDMVRDVYTLVNVPEVTSKISGAVWEDVMHTSASKTVNIVVNGVALTNTAMQRGFVHINIHAPNKPLTMGGVVDNSFPDRSTMYAVRNIVLPLVDAIYKPTFNTYVEDAPDLVQDTDGSWYLQIILSYQSVQEKFKNI